MKPKYHCDKFIISFTVIRLDNDYGNKGEISSRSVSSCFILQYIEFT